MRVLLAGATGAIGRHLVPQLLAAGHDVVGLVRVRGALRGTGAAEIHARVLERSELLAAVAGESFDAVIHQATALKKSPTQYPHMTTTSRLRTEGTSNLLAAARETGAKRFVSASVFYGYGFYDHGDSPLNESEPFAQRTGTPVDDIQLAVLSNEQQSRAAGGIVLRYGIFYGEASASVVASDWHGRLPLVHIEDAAAAAVQAVSHGRAGSAYNIADDNPTSWRELQEVQTIAEGKRLPMKVASRTIRATSPFLGELITRTAMRLDTTRAQRELGWSPHYESFADGLRSSVVLR